MQTGLEQTHTPPQTHPSAGRPGRTLIALALLLLAGTALTAGCGESNGSQPAASASTTGSQPPTNTGTTSTTPGATNTSQAPSATSTVQGSGTASGAKGGQKNGRHFELPPPGSHPAPKISAAERASLPTSDISLSSTAITQHPGTPSTIAATYTCHGANSSPPLHWSGIPTGTKELALFAISTTPVKNKLFFDWSLAHINPALTSLNAAQTPPGAVTGTNSYGHTAYNICPPTGKSETYVFVLYALPRSLSPKQGYDPATLRTQAMHTARHTGLLAGTNG